jgi:hypothetical protein
MHKSPDVKHWTIIAEKLCASGLSWGCSSQMMQLARACIQWTVTARLENDSRFEQTVEDNPKKIGIVNPSTASEPTN